MSFKTWALKSLGGGTGPVGNDAPGAVWIVPGGPVGQGGFRVGMLGGSTTMQSFRSRAEPPESPYTQPRPDWAGPDKNLIGVHHESGASYRENRLADTMMFDPWEASTLQGVADGGMNYGPPPRTNLYKAFEIPRLFRWAIFGWAGLEQMAYTQNARGSADGNGAYLPHPNPQIPGRGVRSISMIRYNTPRPQGGDRIHVPAIFVPTAPIS